MAHTSRWLVLASLVACRHEPAPSAPSSQASDTLTFGEQVQAIVVRDGIVPRTGDAPCAVTDAAACEALCPELSWACAIAGDAHRAQGDEGSAMRFFRRACAGSDPDGCAEVAMRAIANSGGQGVSRAPYALLYLACTPGLSLRACTRGTKIFEARLAWLEEHDDRDDKRFHGEAQGAMIDTACKQFDDPEACGFGSVAELEAQRARDAAQNAHDTAMIAQFRACEEAHPDLECYYADENTVKTRERVQVTSAPVTSAPPPVETRPVKPPVTASRPATTLRPGQISRGDCRDVVYEACHKMEPTYRWQGITDELEIAQLTKKCVDLNQPLVERCINSSCAVAWRHCVDDQSATAEDLARCDQLLCAR